MTTAKKKILVITEWYRPGYKAGGPIQSCANLVDHLSSVFDFYILTTDTDYCETEPYENIISGTWLPQPNGSHIYYLSKSMQTKNKIREIVLQSTWDRVYLNSLFSPLFTLYPLMAARKKKLRIILAVRGMLAPGALALKPLKKKIFLLTARITGLFNKVTFQATSEHEAADIRKNLGEKINVRVAGSLPAKSKINATVIRKKEPGKVKLVQVARIAPEKNLLFALEALSGVKGRVEFDIFGPVYDSDYFEKCQSKASGLPKHITVNFKGPLEHDLLSETLQQYHALFMPTLGENYGHIIIESMAAGLVPVISDRTPWRKLQDKKCGYDIPLQEKEQFEIALEYLCSSTAAEWETWSHSASLFAQQVLENQQTVNDNIALFQNG